MTLKSNTYNLKTNSTNTRLVLTAKEFEIHQLTAVCKVNGYFHMYLKKPGNKGTAETYYIHYNIKMTSSNEIVEEVYKPMIFKLKTPMQLVIECTSSGGEIDVILNTKIIKE